MAGGAGSCHRGAGPAPHRPRCVGQRRRRARCPPEPSVCTLGPDGVQSLLGAEWGGGVFTGRPASAGAPRSPASRALPLRPCRPGREPQNGQVPSEGPAARKCRVRRGPGASWCLHAWSVHQALRRTVVAPVECCGSDSWELSISQVTHAGVTPAGTASCSSVGQPVGRAQSGGRGRPVCHKIPFACKSRSQSIRGRWKSQIQC